MEQVNLFANAHIYESNLFEEDRERVIYQLCEILDSHDHIKQQFRNGYGGMRSLRQLKDLLTQEVELRTYYGDTLRGFLRDGRSIERILRHLQLGYRLERQPASDGFCSFYLFRADTRRGVILEELYRSEDYRFSHELMPRLKHHRGRGEVYLRIPFREWCEKELNLGDRKAIDAALIDDIAPVLCNAVHLDQGLSSACRHLGARFLPDAIEAVYFVLNAPDDLVRLQKTNAKHVLPYLRSERKSYLMRVYRKLINSSAVERSKWADLAAVLYVDLSVLLAELLVLEVEEWGQYKELRVMFDIITANSRRPQFLTRLVKGDRALSESVKDIDKRTNVRLKQFLEAMK